MMNLWLIIPVKPFHCGKSRLADVLDRKQRVDLNEWLLSNLLKVATSVDIISQIVVICQPDRRVESVVRCYGAEFLPEATPELNAALAQARAYVLQQGAESILVCPADLPLITAQDIQQLHRLSKAIPEQQMVIVPSQDGGTNALLLCPPDSIDFAFGLDSCRKHCEQALASGLSYTVWQSRNLAVDVDRPDDLWVLSYKKQV